MSSSRNQQDHPPQHPVAFKRFVFMAALLIALSAYQALAQDTKDHFSFMNVADSTQGLRGFSQFPAINNAGAVAFVATGSDGKQGVFRSREGTVTLIASESGGLLKNFGDDVVINAAGVVGYEASPTTGAVNRMIFTSNGTWTKTIVDAKQQGLVARFLGSPSINASGMVAFFGFRTNFSQAVFIGNGGALTIVADTRDNNFSGFGNAAVNSSGQVVFLGVLEDFSQGVFVAKAVKDPANDDRRGVTPAITSVADPSSGVISDSGVSFGDPVINETGIVADAGGLSNGHLVIFTANGSGITARTDPNGSFFTSSEHPSVNNRGVVAFFATNSNGGQGIFVELTGGASPVSVISTGDALFGSIVTGVDLGRFALNDRDELAFHYDLQDGRSGVAVVSLHKEEGQ